MTGPRLFLHRYLTIAGRIALVTTIVSGFSVLEPSRTQLDAIFVVTFSLLLVGWMAGLFFRRKLAVDWDLTSQVARGEMVTGNLHLRNLGSRSAYDLDATLTNLPEGLEQSSTGLVWRVSCLKPGESTRLNFSVQASRRGAYTLGPLYVGTTFPFALWRLGIHSAEPRRLLVTPRVHPVYHMELDTGGRFQHGAVAKLGQTGESTEFVGVREYRQGDCLRKVHWKLWARRSIPVVREFSREQSSRVAMVLDTYNPPDADLFEAAAEVASSIAHYLAGENTSLGFFAAGQTVHPFSPVEGGSFLSSLVKLLCCLEPTSKLPYESLEAEMRPFLSNISTILLITFCMTPERASFLDGLRQTGVPVRVYAVGKGKNDSQTTYIDPAQIAQCLETL